MYANLSKSFLDKNRDKMNKKAIEAFDEDESSEDCLLFDDGKEGRIEDIENNGVLNVVVENSDLGYFSIDVPIDDDALVNIVEFAVKRLNKLKTVLEGLK